MPLRSACCERWVTEPDNTTNCSIFEEIKHCVCLKFHYLFTFFPPPLINLALYAKQRSSSRVESNKLRLWESSKAVPLLYYYISWTNINLCFDSCTPVLHLKNHPLWTIHSLVTSLWTPVQSHQSNTAALPWILLSQGWHFSVFVKTVRKVTVVLHVNYWGHISGV